MRLNGRRKAGKAGPHLGNRTAKALLRLLFTGNSGGGGGAFFFPILGEILASFIEKSFLIA